MRIFCVLLLSLFVASCATAPVTPAPARAELFNDGLFKAPSERIDKSDIFALSEEMKRYMQSEIAIEVKDKGLHRGFFDTLYTKGQLQLEYDGGTLYLPVYRLGEVQRYVERLATSSERVPRVPHRASGSPWVTLSGWLIAGICDKNISFFVYSYTSFSATAEPV